MPSNAAKCLHAHWMRVTDLENSPNNLSAQVCITCQIKRSGIRIVSTKACNSAPEGKTRTTAFLPDRTDDDGAIWYTRRSLSRELRGQASVRGSQTGRVAGGLPMPPMPRRLLRVIPLSLLDRIWKVEAETGGDGRIDCAHDGSYGRFEALPMLTECSWAANYTCYVLLETLYEVVDAPRRGTAPCRVARIGPFLNGTSPNLNSCSCSSSTAVLDRPACQRDPFYVVTARRARGRRALQGRLTRHARHPQLVSTILPLTANIILLDLYTVNQALRNSRSISTMPSIAEVDGADNGSPPARYSETPPGGVAVLEKAIVSPSDSERSSTSPPSTIGEAFSPSEGTSTAIDSNDHRSVRSTPSSPDTGDMPEQAKSAPVDEDHPSNAAMPEPDGRRTADSQDGRAEPSPRESGCAAEVGSDNDDDDDSTNIEEPTGIMPNMTGGGQKKPRKSRRTFGVRHNMQNFHYLNPDNYEQKYPADELGKCLDDNARVWKVYLDEAKMMDDDMVEAWKDTVDVLLVFAGLFSAVVTTLVVQSSQSLQPDYSQVSAMLLTELVGLQRAMADGVSANTVAMSAQNATSGFTAARTDQWVNRLWFISLTFSLATALICVLVKQWLQYYVSPISGTSKKKAHIRHFCYAGLQKWHVSGIVGYLPIFMHIALLLFLIGLVLFLVPLDKVTAGMIGFLASSLYMMYLVANMLPAIYVDCAYKTPISDIMSHLKYDQLLEMIEVSPHILTHFGPWEELLEQHSKESANKKWWKLGWQVLKRVKGTGSGV
ncbi:hypothetical protein EVG20_g6786 [Dentipellis fragilis]|uniref:DUF6535 domain-containing protein n=1 Tax=Dentipellis fragilis TaxID=205917 RepID=A0A4Y9YJP2_9AGAM|nr:hypothetical protein EVG20_g6786 [Dentipellis fragilis]